MTTTSERKKKCAVCGEVSKHSVVRSAGRHGSPDLDTRPPSLERFTIDTWVQRCPSCGYCSWSISRRVPRGASEVVRSELYQVQLRSRDFPRLANQFLCWSLVQEQAGNFAGAGWACIHAAWVCDDAAEFNMLYGNVSGQEMGVRDEAAAARNCRLKAALLLARARERGQRFGVQVGSEEALMADLLRRAGRFDSAIRMADCGLNEDPKEVLACILELQKKLAASSDAGCHTIAEAIKGKRDSILKKMDKDAEPGGGEQAPGK
ncbi:MAG: hypothetical protein AB1603_06390 [Chloroflexota bacterium]